VEVPGAARRNGGAVRRVVPESAGYVAAAAQSGLHPNGRETYGDTMIVDGWGRVATRLPRGSGFVSAEIDRDAMKNNTWLGWLRSMIRPVRGD
jgi:predicted amidohydrolase